MFKPFESKPMMIDGVRQGMIYVRDFGESFTAVCIIPRSKGRTAEILHSFLCEYGWGPKTCGGPGQRFADDIFIKRSRSRVSVTWNGGLDI